tara:strand:- start:2032 stop:2307 length:276 start_codon:yes stop_codon:yes gene_type:complete
MKNLIKNRVREFLTESIKNSSSSEWNICNDFSVNNYDELIDLLKKSDIEQKDWDNVQGILNKLKSDIEDEATNDEDLFNTATHKIASRLCK